MKTATTARNNFLKKIVCQIAANPPRPGSMVRVVVQHDPWCDWIARRGVCNCDPNVLFMEDGTK